MLLEVVQTDAELIADLLISKYNMYLNFRDDMGRLLLYLSDDKTVDLITAKYDVHLDTKDDRGYTSLIYRILREESAVSVFAKHGANFNAKDNQGLAALSHAAIRHSEYFSQYSNPYVHIKVN